MVYPAYMPGTRYNFRIYTSHSFRTRFITRIVVHHHRSRLWNIWFHHIYHPHLTLAFINGNRLPCSPHTRLLMPFNHTTWFLMPLTISAKDRERWRVDFVLCCCAVGLARPEAPLKCWFCTMLLCSRFCKAWSPQCILIRFQHSFQLKPKTLPTALCLAFRNDDRPP